MQIIFREIGKAMAGGVNPLLSGAGSPPGGTFCSLNIIVCKFTVSKNKIRKPISDVHFYLSVLSDVDNYFSQCVLYASK